MRIPVMILIAAGGLIALPPCPGAKAQSMTQTPVSVPLDFLARIDRDPAWLAEAMAGLDAGQGFAIDGTTLRADTPEALRAVNRIRAFASIAAKSLTVPYVDLMLATADGPQRCPTLFPEEIVPGITAMDFARTDLSAAKADPTLLSLCKVDPGRSAEYAGLDRDTFRERYFDAAGDLRAEFAALNTDAALVARAIDLGFLVTQSDLTGRLKLARE